MLSKDAATYTIDTREVYEWRNIQWMLENIRHRIRQKQGCFVGNKAHNYIGVDSKSSSDFHRKNNVENNV